MKASTLKWWAWKLGSEGRLLPAATQKLVSLEIVEPEAATSIASDASSWELRTRDGHMLRGGGVLDAELARALVDGLVQGS
jgi:hypothetical protein